MITRINPRRRRDGKHAVTITFPGRGQGPGSSFGKTFRKIYSVDTLNDAIARQSETDTVFFGGRVLSADDVM